MSGLCDNDDNCIEVNLAFKHYRNFMMLIPPHIPKKIESSRLILRAPRHEDSYIIFDAVKMSSAELSPWMFWATPDYSFDDCRKNTEGAIKSFDAKENLRFHVFERETGDFVVSSGLHPCAGDDKIAWNVPKVEIGYWCHSQKVGQGFVAETVRVLTRMAFEQLKVARVQIRCDDKNVASYRVAESCGFQLEGILKNDERTPSGDLRDTRIYAMTELGQLRLRLSS